MRLQIMVAVALAAVLITASCGGDQDNGSVGVATLLGTDSSEMDPLLTAAATPESTTSESDAATIPAVTAG